MTSRPLITVINLHDVDNDLRRQVASQGHSELTFDISASVFNGTIPF